MVEAEFVPDLFHKKGVLAAARDNNPAKASSGMQFYLAQGKVYNDSLLDKALERINVRVAQEYFENKPSKNPLLDSLQKAMEARNMERYRILSDSMYSLAIKDESFKPYTIPKAQREVYKSVGGIPHLDQNYTVFGEVIEGIDVLDAIANVATNTLDRPVKEVRILEVKVIKNKGR